MGNNFFFIKEVWKCNSVFVISIEVLMKISDWYLAKNCSYYPTLPSKSKFDTRPRPKKIIPLIIQCNCKQELINSLQKLMGLPLHWLLWAVFQLAFSWREHLEPFYWLPIGDKYITKTWCQRLSKFLDGSIFKIWFSKKKKKIEKRFNLLCSCTYKKKYPNTFTFT